MASELAEAERKLLDWLASHDTAVWVDFSYRGVAKRLIRRGLVYPHCGLFGVTQAGRERLDGRGSWAK